MIAVIHDLYIFVLSVHLELADGKMLLIAVTSRSLLNLEAVVVVSRAAVKDMNTIQP